MKKERPFYMVLVLGGTTAVAAFLLSLVYAQTKGPIETKKQNAINAAMRELVPEATRFEADSVCDCVRIYDSENRLKGYIIVNKEKGYSSFIEVMVAVDPSFFIKGIKILSQQETPGLGTQISEIKSDKTIWDTKRVDGETKPLPWFLARFIGKGLMDIKSVDTITGATISSSAVKRALEKAIKRIMDCVNNKGE